MVVLYSNEAEYGFKGLHKIVADTVEDGIQTIRVRYKRSPIPKTSVFFYIWSILAGYRKLLKHNWVPAVIHAHIYSAGVPAVVLGKLFKKPVIITEHWTAFPRRSVKDSTY